MQAIKAKMMVGDLVAVPDRIFMGVRDLGGVARIIQNRAIQRQRCKPRHQQASCF